MGRDLGPVLAEELDSFDEPVMLIFGPIAVTFAPDQLDLVFGLLLGFELSSAALKLRLSGHLTVIGLAVL